MHLYNKCVFLKINKLQYDIIIVGGGLAGLCASIHLSQKGKSVLVIEKHSFGKHKVCGEYISNEVLPYLVFLGIDVFSLGATKINKFELSTHNNKLITSKLPLGGFGISRYLLDKSLAEKAKKVGVQIQHDTVDVIDFSNNIFTVKTQSNLTLTSNLVIGAYGKRSNIDVKLNRPFIKQKSPFLGVKIHVKGNFPNDVIALHNFEGGYCGVSKVEDDRINMCYITNYKSFKKYKSIEEFQKQVVYKNKFLKTLFENSIPQFEAPLSISQISFSNKNPVENHIIMCGDTAGMIHPLCGNGMSMAIRSAQMASVLILNYLEGYITRDDLEKKYSKQWNDNFKIRLKAGHFVAKLFDKEHLTEKLVAFLNYIPSVLPKIIQLTHGKPMKIK